MQRRPRVEAGITRVRFKGGRRSKANVLGTRAFFRVYDTNGDNLINREEFGLLLKDLNENVSSDVQANIFSAADTDNSNTINFEEFIACMLAFALDPRKDYPVPGAPKRLPTESVYTQAGSEDAEAEEEDMPEDLTDLSPAEQQRLLKKRAFQGMFIGTVLVLLFSDPMCDMLDMIGKKTGVPSFYVSFILAPLASNASELVSAMKLASKRTPSSMVQSLSTLEGAAIMNNTFCLGIFFLLIAWKGLVWQFSAETIVIILIQLVVGYLAAAKKVHTLLDGVFILSLYPASLVVVYVLENVFMLD